MWTKVNIKITNTHFHLWRTAQEELWGTSKIFVLASVPISNIKLIGTRMCLHLDQGGSREGKKPMHFKKAPSALELDGLEKWQFNIIKFYCVIWCQNIASTSYYFPNSSSTRWNKFSSLFKNSMSLEDEKRVKTNNTPFNHAINQKDSSPTVISEECFFFIPIIKSHDEWDCSSNITHTRGEIEW